MITVDPGPTPDIGRQDHHGTSLTAPTGPVVVADVMTTAVVAAHTGAAFKEIVDALERNRIGSVPVIDDDRRVVGVVSESDLLTRIVHSEASLPPHHLGHKDLNRKIHALTAAELMTSPAVVTTPGMPITTAAWHASRRRVRRMPVIDVDGILIGMVSRLDLLRGYLRPDAEIGDDVVHNVVEHSLGVAPGTITVGVDEGVVTLSGHLDERFEVTDLVEAVRCVSGVVEVDADAVTYSHDDAR